MFSYWQHNKNVILAAVALFIVSLTALLFFLSEDTANHGELKADVVDSLTLKSEMEEEKSYRDEIGEQEGPFIVVKPDGLIDFMSWEYETMTGYAKDDVKEELFFSFIHPEDLPKIISAFGKVIANGTPMMMIGPYRMRNSNGEYHFHIASLYPVMKHDKVEKIAFVCRDITAELEETEKNEQQEAAEEEENKVSHGKKIRDEKENDDKKLVVEKLAQLIDLP